MFEYRRIGALVLALTLAAPIAASADATASAPAPAPPPIVSTRFSTATVAKLRTRIAAILAAARTGELRGAHVAFLAIDAKRGTLIDAVHPDGDFIPASTFKLIVGSASLDLLGAEHRFVTTLSSDGTRAGTALHGDLILRGGGDPTLDGKVLREAARAVARSGITRVDGALLLDNTAFRYPSALYRPGWAWDDLTYGYGAPTDALSLDENALHITVSPGAHPGSAVTLSVSPQTPSLQIENHAITGSSEASDSIDAMRPWNDPNVVRIIGVIPQGAKAPDRFRVAVENPQAFVGDAFLADLEANGVAIAAGMRTDPLPPHATTIWEHRSPPLSTILARMWQPSDNFIAEMLFRHLGGARAERAWLRRVGVDPQRLTIVDGSGLSAYDRITPRALVRILQYDRAPQRKAIVEAALPLSGVRGTLKDRFRDPILRGKIDAKTGSVNHVRTLAGYLQTERHGTVTFALLVNDWMDRGPGAMKRLDAVRGAILRAIATAP
ncbi:MAG: D-alanyl-D-alanine carboxypeptidase/D-alanyl-D-alanine-endopeptidase [Candidatus Eremiobacteraeota bacterium]|nr:D-alanyl-D-alanine carboxypeptidase/D-alanyl-D-alanine-endopeptidase [Candidatus Eremiobacteraeota bacterium]